MAVKKTKKETVNWRYNGKEITCLADMPQGAIAFIYRIDNLNTGKYYVGRKTFAGNKKKKLTVKEKLLPENNRKTFKYEFCESSGWKSYCGSNTLLKSEVKAGHKVVKTILRFCYTKAEITLEETRELICGGVLEDSLSYNDWVSCKIFKRHLTLK